MGVQPIDPAALTRGPVVAYGQQAFLVLIAFSGIRHDFSGIGACGLQCGVFFTTICALGHMWWTMGIMRTTYSGWLSESKEKALSNVRFCRKLSRVSELILVSENISGWKTIPSVASKRFADLEPEQRFWVLEKPDRLCFRTEIGLTVRFGKRWPRESKIYAYKRKARLNAFEMEENTEINKVVTIVSSAKE